MAELFQYRQASPPVGQVKPERDHESRCYQFSSDRANPDLHQSCAKRSSQQAYQQVTTDPSAVIAELIDEQ